MVGALRLNTLGCQPAYGMGKQRHLDEHFRPPTVNLGRCSCPEAEDNGTDPYYAT
jgi:hypothetical protein